MYLTFITSLDNYVLIKVSLLADNKWTEDDLEETFSVFKQFAQLLEEKYPGLTTQFLTFVEVSYHFSTFLFITYFFLKAN